MGLYDNEDEDDDLVGPKIEDASLPAQYGRLAKDTGAVTEARSSADSGNKWANILQAVAGLGGKEHVNGAVFDSVRSGNNAKADIADREHKQRLLDFVNRDKLAKGEQEHNWKASSNDPASKPSAAMRAIFAKQQGMTPEELDGMSFEQLRELKSGNGKSRVTAENVELPDGRVVHAWVDPDSRTITPTDYKAGFKQTFDSATGTRVSGADRASPASPVQTEGGGKLSDLRTELTQDRAFASGQGSQAAKNVQGSKEADARVTHTNNLTSNFQKLYDDASKEGKFGNTGPVMGRVAGGLSAAGVDMGPATNKAQADMDREGQKYVVEMTGLTSTDEQYKRLMSNMPNLGMAPEVFKARMKSWTEAIQNEAAKKKQIAGPNAAAPAAEETHSESFPRTLRNAEGDEATVNDASELQEAMAEGFQ